MTLDREEKKLEFYGGTWIALLPFIIFLALILLTTFFWGSISDGALWVPAFAAIMIPFFFAKDKKYYSEVVIEGMASKEAIIPVYAGSLPAYFPESFVCPDWQTASPVLLPVLA